MYVRFTHPVHGYECAVDLDQYEEQLYMESKNKEQFLVDLFDKLLAWSE